MKDQLRYVLKNGDQISANKEKGSNNGNSMWADDSVEEENRHLLSSNVLTKDYSNSRGFLHLAATDRLNSDSPSLGSGSQRKSLRNLFPSVGEKNDL
jgi:hypothetical protein